MIIALKHNWVCLKGKAHLQHLGEEEPHRGLYIEDKYPRRGYPNLWRHLLQLKNLKIKSWQDSKGDQRLWAGRSDH